MAYILALDEGTTSARAALYDELGRRLAIASKPIETRFPQPGWVEQDADSIWQAQKEAIQEVLSSTGIQVSQIRSIGITNQRETTILWDRKTGTPVAPAIVWQCRRTESICRQLQSQGLGPWIQQKTGLVIDPYFSATKIAWLLENIPEAKKKAQDGDILFGTVDSWLVWKLTGHKTHITDISNASRTMLMNLATGQWDSELLSLFDIPEGVLPRIVPSYGELAVADGSVLGAEVPIGGIAGDQQAALFGQAIFSQGRAKNTYGTGCFLLAHTGNQLPKSSNNLVATRAASGPGEQQFALEGSVFIAGAAIQWLRDQLKLIQTAEESESLATSVPDSGGVYFVPAFVGLGAPHWDPAARGLIWGLTRGTTRAHIVRATLEAIAYQTADLMKAVENDLGQLPRELRVDGGAARNNFLMQFQADILGIPVVRPVDIETTALGAAYLAGLAQKIFRSTEQIDSFWKAERIFEPRLPESQRQVLLEGWQEAVRRARSHEFAVK